MNLRMPMIMFDKVDYFILAATMVSFLLSMAMWINDKPHSAIFVGLWVPSILGFGIYLIIKKHFRTKR